MPKEPKTSYDRFVARVRRHDGGNRSVDRGLENNVPIPNAILFPLLIQDVQKGKTCTLRLRGNSMRPFLENERDLAIFTTPEGVKVGDPVLAEIEKGHYVLHRIMKIEDDDVTLMGDGNFGCEYCKTSDFRCGVIGFIRKGRLKVDRTDGLKWKAYSWFWVKFTFMRRWLLLAYRYGWLNIFKLKAYPPLKQEAIDELVAKYGKKTNNHK
jgi:hypothetical protein